MAFWSDIYLDMNFLLICKVITKKYQNNTQNGKFCVVFGNWSEFLCGRYSVFRVCIYCLLLVSAAVSMYLLQQCFWQISVTSLHEWHVPHMCRCRDLYHVVVQCASELHQNQTCVFWQNSNRMLVSEVNRTRPTQVCSTLITLWAGVYENNKTYMGQQWLDTQSGKEHWTDR